ncbi:MAG: biphenyl 2,3-dioxygenase [Pelagibacteraceae bacterium]|nr:biphenyl 2,3-dioxygenase [Pelagibacteraceae bacterium]|tara:strand:- start:2848 stop:3558 length:711 start_codon:yes stop_codon:yes gene_type:complete
MTYYYLQSTDYVGISFWIVSVAMFAATVFFLYEGMNVKSSWRVSMLVVGLVTLIATVHYYYMRELWVNTGESPIVYRYIDWLLTVPLQMIEFYLILVAAGLAVSSNVFWRLLIGTLVMLLGGYAGENGWISPTLGFVIGMAGWIFIVFEIFRGESSVIATKNDSIKYAFRAMGLIVVIGWSIYPIGYIFGLLTPMIGLGTVNINFLNITYNLADFINKILFGLIIWNAAIKDSKSS